MILVIRSTMFELCVLCVVIFAPLTFAYDCKIEYGKEPNLEDHGCESYWDCHKHQGTLKQCLGNKQFDFKLRECMPNSEVWCQWQHQQIREMRSGNSISHAQKPKIQHVHHVPKPRKNLGSRRVVKVIKVKSPGHSHDHEHEDGTVHSHPHGHDDHHHDHGHHEPNIVTSFIHSHDGSTHKHLVDENGQFVDSTDHYHLKKEDEADYHDSSDYHDYSSDYHDTSDNHRPRPSGPKKGRGKGGIGYGKFQDGGSGPEPEIVKTVTHTHDGSTHTHFVDDKGDYSYDYDPNIIYQDDYNNKNYEYYDEHYDDSDSNHVDMDYDVGSPHDSDYKDYEYDYNSEYDYNYDYDDVISWGYMCASKFSHEPNMKDSKCKTFYRCDNYKGTKIFCKPDHLYDFHAKACRYHTKVDCHHQMHDYEKEELKHHIEIEKKDNGMTIVHHYYHGGKKGLDKLTDTAMKGQGLLGSLQNIPLEAALSPFGAIGALLLGTRRRNAQYDIRNRAANALLVSGILDLASSNSRQGAELGAPLVTRRDTRTPLSMSGSRGLNTPNAVAAMSPPAQAAPLSLGTETVVTATGRMNDDGTGFVSAVVSEWAPKSTKSAESDLRRVELHKGEGASEEHEGKSQALEESKQGPDENDNNSNSVEAILSDITSSRLNKVSAKSRESSVELKNDVDVSEDRNAKSSESASHEGTDYNHDKEILRDRSNGKPQNSDFGIPATTIPKTDVKFITATEPPAKVNPIPEFHMTKLFNQPNFLTKGIGSRKFKAKPGLRHHLSPPYYAYKGSITEVPSPANVPDVSDIKHVAITALDQDSHRNPSYNTIMPVNVGKPFMAIKPSYDDSSSNPPYQMPIDVNTFKLKPFEGRNSLRKTPRPNLPPPLMSKSGTTAPTPDIPQGAPIVPPPLESFDMGNSQQAQDCDIENHERSGNLGGQLSDAAKAKLLI